MKTYIQPNEMAQQEYFDRLHQQRALEVLAQAKKCSALHAFCLTILAV